MTLSILKVLNFLKCLRVSVLTTRSTAGSRPANSQSEREISWEVVLCHIIKVHTAYEVANNDIKVGNKLHIVILHVDQQKHCDDNMPTKITKAFHSSFVLPTNGFLVGT